MNLIWIPRSVAKARILESKGMIAETKTYLYIFRRLASPKFTFWLNDFIVKINFLCYFKVTLILIFNPASFWLQLKFQSANNKWELWPHIRFSAWGASEVMTLFLQLELVAFFAYNFHGFMLLVVCFSLFSIWIRRLLKWRCVSLYNMHKQLHWETKSISVKHWNSFLSFNLAPKIFVYASICHLLSLAV